MYSIIIGAGIVGIISGFLNWPWWIGGLLGALWGLFCSSWNLP